MAEAASTVHAWAADQNWPRRLKKRLRSNSRFMLGTAGSAVFGFLAAVAYSHGRFVGLLLGVVLGALAVMVGLVVFVEVREASRRISLVDGRLMCEGWASRSDSCDATAIETLLERTVTFGAALSGAPAVFGIDEQARCQFWFYKENWPSELATELALALRAKFVRRADEQVPHSQLRAIYPDLPANW